MQRRDEWQVILRCIVPGWSVTECRKFVINSSERRYQVSSHPDQSFAEHNLPGSSYEAGRSIRMPIQ